MPLTTGFTTRGVMKGEGHIHTDTWHRCWTKVQAKGHDSSASAAICTNSVGYEGSINEPHRTGGEHASANPRRFYNAKRRRDRAKAKAAQKREAQVPDSFEWVLKFNPNHDEKGLFSSAPGGSTKSKEQGKGGKGSIELDATPEKPTPEQRQAHADVVRQTAKPVYKVKTAEEAVERVLRGENVEIETTKDVHTILKKLGEIAIEAKSKKSEAPNFDPCTITVKGVSLFCTERIRTEEFPGGVPRLAMPQFKSANPVPGSEADKLPRVKGEVDATQAFLDYLASAGVKSNRDAVVKASALKASQAEMEGSKVAGMMLNPKFDPKVQKITVTRDGYVVDGHHTWAAAVGRDAEDGILGNDMELEVVMIDLPMSTVYHIANRWTKKYGMPQAGVKKFEQMLRFLRHA